VYQGRGGGYESENAGAVPRQIQFFGFENILYESNIWVLFLKLKSVEIKGRNEFYRCTKDGYRQYLLENIPVVWSVRDKAVEDSTNRNLLNRKK